MWAELKFHVLKFWRPGQKSVKCRRNGACFCNGYNDLAFICNALDRHEIPAKTSIDVLCLILIEF